MYVSIYTNISIVEAAGEPGGEVVDEPPGDAGRACCSHPNSGPQPSRSVSSGFLSKLQSNVPSKFKSFPSSNEKASNKSSPVQVLTAN